MGRKSERAKFGTMRNNWVVPFMFYIRDDILYPSRFEAALSRACGEHWLCCYNIWNPISLDFSYADDSLTVKIYRQHSSSSSASHMVSTHKLWKWQKGLSLTLMHVDTFRLQVNAISVYWTEMTTWWKF